MATYDKEEKEDIPQIIYFVKFLHTKKVKIGITQDIQERLQQLSYDIDSVKLLAYINNATTKLERELHSIFASKRIDANLELFRLTTDEIKTFLNGSNFDYVIY